MGRICSVIICVCLLVCFVNVEGFSADLRKATFHLSDGDVPTWVNTGTIEVLFNPREYTITKATPWKHHDIQGLDAPEFEFLAGEPFDLAMELLFDTYEEGIDVREYTDRIESLAVIDPELHRPPVVLLSWEDSLTFKCILESFSTRFTLFYEDGIPVRAIMNCVFKEFSLANEQLTHGRRGD